MKRVFLVIGLVFAITLAVTFSLRVSPDAMAVVIGVILGVAASIPTTLLLVYILTRQPRPENPVQPMPPQPPVFVINAAEKTPSYSPPLLPASFTSPDNGRKWTVIGDVETDSPAK